jgi:tetratricopeptide (TPR) repeat protein
LGHTDMIEGKLRDALAKFMEVVRRSGETHVAAMFEVGCIYQELGKYDQAILAFRKVLVRDRTNVQAIVNVARRLQAMGMRPEALGYYIKAADTAMEAKQFGTCRQLLNLILSIDPLNPKVRSMLADLSDLDAGDSIVISSVELPAALEPDANLQGLVQSPSEVEDGLVALLRDEADGLKRDLKALGAAKASEEIELATLRARRDAATAELTELFKKIGSLRPADKPKLGGKTKATEKPKVVDQPKPAVLVAPGEAPKKRRAPTKSKTRPDRTRE